MSAIELHEKEIVGGRSRQGIDCWGVLEYMRLFVEVYQLLLRRWDLRTFFISSWIFSAAFFALRAIALVYWVGQ